MSEMRLQYDMTIEDPEVFIEPWVMPTRVLLAQGGGDGGMFRSARIAKCTKPVRSRRS